MTMRIECDFRHGLAGPTITRELAGPLLSLAHGCQRSPKESHSGSPI
jgi:hypothetical protein